MVHPFTETIEQQYQYHRKEILNRVFDAEDILPEFELKMIKAVQTIAGNRNKRFEIWFDALDWMKEECAKVDFDVAIIGCGAYGFPLAAEIKRMGKVVIHMGGAAQLLFGLKGKCWEEGQFAGYKEMVNSSWTRPNERVKNLERVEGGCYW